MTRFKAPTGLLVDDLGFLLVSDSVLGKLMLFNPQGAFIKGRKRTLSNSHPTWNEDNIIWSDTQKHILFFYFHIKFFFIIIYYLVSLTWLNLNPDWKRAKYNGDEVSVAGWIKQSQSIIQAWYLRILLSYWLI